MIRSLTDAASCSLYLTELSLPSWLDRKRADQSWSLASWELARAAPDGSLLSNSRTRASRSENIETRSDEIHIS